MKNPRMKSIAWKLSEAGLWRQGLLFPGFYPVTNIADVQREFIAPDILNEMFEGATNGGK